MLRTGSERLEDLTAMRFLVARITTSLSARLLVVSAASPPGASATAPAKPGGFLSQISDLV
jgi:hypothetical protein